MNSNKTAHEDYKRKERERKRTTELRKNVLIDYHQNSEEPLAPSTFFSNAAIKLRSVKKAEKSLRRKREFITRLVSKFQVPLKFGEKIGRKKNALSAEEVNWVIAFLNQPDILYTSPGRKNSVHVRTFSKVRKFAQKRYFLWTVR